MGAIVPARIGRHRGLFRWLVIAYLSPTTLTTIAKGEAWYIPAPSVGARRTAVAASVLTTRVSWRK